MDEMLEFPLLKESTQVNQGTRISIEKLRNSPYGE
jgi:hypothetical protein